MENSSGSVSSGDSLFVRINGVLPDVSGTAEAHTSISAFSSGFHLLVDAGNGVASSIKKGALDLGYKEEPDAILVTHGRREHISDIASFSSSKIFCTGECADQIAKEFPQLEKSRLSSVSPGQLFKTGPFSIVPIAADNSGDDRQGTPGSVIYVISSEDRKIVAGWDFLNLQNVNPELMWNPDLVVLGTETYNDHPSTGMISVTQAYHLVKTWNAKDCYILHYSGEKDKEDAKNQWHRGPAGPLSQEKLQRAIDDYLRMSGQEGRFSIKVAREGMVWRPAAVGRSDSEDEGPVGNKIEIEALEKYVFKIEKMRDNKLTFVLEDSINRLVNEFVNPRRGSNNNNNDDDHAHSGNYYSLHADPVKSMMMKGPELDLSVSDTIVKASITKGKKQVFADTIRVSERDAKKLARYIRENF
jgi:L-ascorbate metabolism protein UlaG (beta-lactamase superfamily)